MSTRSEMPGRLLRLLSLLQSRQSWSGSELAERLGITDRTLRRDVERLRALDYPVRGTTGTAGGYRLVSGANLPPLQLDDTEAVAVAVGLATAAGGNVAGLEDSAMSALMKLDQVLPARLRSRLRALSGVSAAVPPRSTAPADPAVLALLAGCCRDTELVSFTYRGRGGRPGPRRVEPHHLVTLRGFWYLIAYDPDRADWRTFRLDRIEDPRPTRHRFTARELPAPDAATYLAGSLASATYRHTAVVTVQLPVDALRAGIFGPIPGVVTPTGATECTVRLSADSIELVVQYIASILALGAECTLEAPPEVAGQLRRLGARLALS